MKYKNIVFDFGNVIGTFNGREIIRSFVTDETDVDYLCDLIYAHWTATDACICPGIERAGNPGLSPFQCTDLLCRLYEGSRDPEAFRRDPVLCSDPHGKTGSGNLRIFLPQI